MSTVFIIYLIIVSFTSANAQSLLFPHGYFDTNKLSAIDAFYLHMLAISTLEHDGVTLDQLDQLWKDRIEAPRPKTEDESVLGRSPKPVLPSTTEGHVEDEGGLTVQENHEIPGKGPKEPFRQSRAADTSDDNDDIETSNANPFDSIATRPPPRLPTPIAVPRGFLTRDQILGVSGKRPRQRHFEQVVRITTKSTINQARGLVDDPLRGIDEFLLTTIAPITKRRKLYAKLDWSKPHIIELPIPPSLE